MTKKGKCIVLLSGGMDSTTLLALAIQQIKTVEALTLFYGQRHHVEIDAAKEVASHFGVPHKVLDISNINQLLQGSALTTMDIPIPEGHYESESMKQTVVPGRNAILLSLALGYAISRNFDMVAYAAHAGDHAIYPDCRREFVVAMADVFCLAHYYPVGLWVPFLKLDKGDILSIGEPLQVPYELTWTCYNPHFSVDDPEGPGPPVSCGKCGSCQERLEGFTKIGKTDPIKYVD